MNLYEKISLTSLLFLSITGVLSCNVVSEEKPPIVPQEENKGTIFYTTPELGLSINPLSFDKLKDSKSFTVVKGIGEVKFVENGNVLYQAPKNTIITQDNFTLQGTNLSQQVVSEIVTINLVNNIANFPCNAGAIGDTKNVAIGVPTEIDVIANDKTCGVIQENSLKVEIPPKYGTIEIKNQKIIYTSQLGFLGEDIFFYKIGINNSKNPIAPVTVTINELKECTQGLQDDAVNLLSYTLGSEIEIDVLQNDKICDRYKDAQLKIVTNPKIGSVRVANSKIYYKKTQAIAGNDSFEYALYQSEKVFIKASVAVGF